MDANLIASSVLNGDDSNATSIVMGSAEHLSSAEVLTLIEKITNHHQIGVACTLTDAQLAILAEHLGRLLPLVERSKLSSLLCPWEEGFLEENG